MTTAPAPSADGLCHCRCDRCGEHRPCPGIAGEDDVGLCECDGAPWSDARPRGPCNDVLDAFLAAHPDGIAR